MKNLILTLVFVAINVLASYSQIFYKVEVSGNPGDSIKPSYIFGSHHLVPLDILEKAGVAPYLQATERVVGELDLTQDPVIISMAVQPHMMAPADSTLSILLKGQDIEALNNQFQKWAPMPGMQLQMLDALKPMAVNAMVAVGIGAQVIPDYDPNQQIDSFIMKEGKKQGKEILPLETPDYQGYILFDTTPLSIQAESLVDMLTNIEDTLDKTRKLTEVYQNRDMEGMLEFSKQTDDHPEFMENILYRRNREWMEKLPEIINEKPTFIVVGALHLAGPQGILQLLQNEGFKITPIY